MRIKYFLFIKMGNKRDKTRFVNVGNQEWQEWIESIVAKAAKYNLLVDIHDAYRPNGFMSYLSQFADTRRNTWQ